MKLFPRSIRGKLFFFGTLLTFTPLFFSCLLIADLRLNSLDELQQTNTSTVTTVLEEEWAKKVRAVTVILADTFIHSIVNEDFYQIYALIQMVMHEDKFDYIYVQDLDGMIQVDSSDNAMKVGLLQEDAPFFQALETGQPVIQIDESLNSTQVVAPIMVDATRYGVIRIGYSLEKIQQTTAQIHNQMAANINQGMQKIISKLMFSTLLVMILAFVAGGLILRSILQPVNRLTLGVQQAATGDLSYRIPDERDDQATSVDELGLLTRAFNTMLDQLEEQRAHVLKYYKDIDHLRKYLDNIYNSMPSVLIGVDPDGKVTQWNLEAEKRTGISAEEAKNNPINSLLPRMAGELDKITQAVADRTVLTCEKIPHHHKDAILYEDLTIYPLIANGIDGAVIRIDDVTERVRLEEMMIQTEKMMSVGGLAAGMAHEINNPLAAILQNLQVLDLYLLKDSPKNRAIAEKCHVDLEQMHDFMAERNIRTIVDSVMEAGLRAKKIVANMLSFSRKSDQGKKPCDMADLIEQTIELAGNDYDLKKKFDFRKISIIREFEDSLPPVFCEAGQIQQVLLNLFKNGAQAMGETSHDKEEKSSFIVRLLQKNDMICLEIEDNGPGMDEKIRKRIFEPFFTTKDPGLGTGLGLSVSYFIVCDTHGGTLTVRSRKGVGATFSMELPIAHA